LLTHAVPKTAQRKRLHQLDYYLEIVKTAGLSGDGKKTEIFLSAAERNRAEQILGQAGADPEKPCVGINPGAAYGTAKRWFPRRFIELIRQIRANYSVNVVLFGSARETKLGETIQKGAGNDCVNLIGRTSLREAMGVTEKCRLFITNDSGLMHVAAALDIPSIAIFGSTDHVTTRPAGTNAQIIRKPSSCSPCMKPECTVEGHPCMENIGVTDVFAAASGILNNPG
jgi:heptosyltransferase-2